MTFEQVDASRVFNSNTWFIWLFDRQNISVLIAFSLSSLSNHLNLRTSESLSDNSVDDTVLHKLIVHMEALLCF